MAASIEAPLSSLLELRAHRFATLWLITRTDGTTFALTDHDSTIEFQGRTFSPTGAVSLSARRKEAGLAPQNVSFRGAISSSLITTEDLEFGRYEEAQIDEYLVDWNVPWASNDGTIESGFLHSRYWIVDVRFNGEVWEANVEGLPRWLRPRVGWLHSRTCRHQLGDGLATGVGCTVDVDSLTVYNATVATVTDRRNFGGSATFFNFPPYTTDQYFQVGSVRWRTGDNVGHLSTVRNYQATPTVEFELDLPTPRAIQVADKFDAVPGCDGAFSTCRDVHDNVVDFGGDPFMPGTNAVVADPRTPRTDG